MPQIPDIQGAGSPSVSLKASSFGRETVTAGFNVSPVDFVRVQAFETSGASWDSATLNVEWSLDGSSWVASGTSLTADGITSQIDVSSIPFIRVAKGTDATSSTPVVRVIVHGEVDR
jgi:hypothetical protein